MTTVAVLSHIVVDEVFDADRRPVGIEVGGAGAYAAVGASLAGADGGTFLVSGVGSEDRALLSDWCARRQIAVDGLFDVGPHSPRTRIQYFADGEREETPVFGLAHFDAHTPLPRHIPAAAAPLGGTYLFHDLDAAYWGEVVPFARRSTGPLLWEISLDACRSENRGAAWEALDAVDVLSINETESFALLGVATVEEAVAQFADAGATVLLRRGARGSLVIDGDDVWRVGTSPTQAQDPTGGGNSYSGAFLAALVRSGDPVESARLAAAVASAVVAAPGAPEVDDAARLAVASAAAVVRVDRH